MIPGIDASFSRITREQFRQFKAAGYEVFVQALWTGGYANNEALREVANANLRDAESEGLAIAGYINASPWRPVDLWMLEAQTNAGDMWPDLKVIAVDYEIEGTPEGSVKALCEALEAAGRKVCIYTAKWYWERSGSPQWASLSRWPLWVAQYDGNPEGGNLFGPFTKLVGKQFAGSTQMFGATVDLNVFDPDFWLPQEGDMDQKTFDAMLEAAPKLAAIGEIDATQSKQIAELQAELGAVRDRLAILGALSLTAIEDRLRRGGDIIAGRAKDIP